MKKNLLILIAFLFSLQLISQDIVQWRGDNRDGKYPDTELLKEWPAEGPEMLWHFDELGTGHASVAVSNDLVYTAGTIDTTGYIFAFKLNGELLWKEAYGPEWTQSWPGVRSTPLIVDDNLYLLTGFGKLFSMNIVDQSINWTVDIITEYEGRNIVWGFCENLLADNEKLFVTVGGEESNVIAVNRMDGKLIWETKANAEMSAYCSPALINHNGRKLFVTHTQHSVIGIDVNTGEFLWSSEWKNKYSIHPNTPIYNDGKIYCVSGYGSGGFMLELSENGDSVSKLWENNLLDNQMGGVILFDGKLYGGGHTNRSFYCLDGQNGEVLFQTKELQLGNTIYADGHLYFYDEKKGVIALIYPDGANTRVVSKFKVPYGSAQHWAHSVIANKTLYIRHGNSLMVYSIAAN